MGWAYLDAFVGRARELELLGDLVARGERLVTVVGPGGIGKTRLVEELLPRVANAETLACDLTGVREIDGIRRLIALALDASGPGDASSIEAIGGGLRARGETVLFLDNCEHVVGAVAEIVRALLDAAPRLRVVSASRERLHLRGEHVLELTPLGLPERVEDVEGSEAFVLLLDRLRRARVGYAVDAAERKVLFDLVRSLDGVPLAIELAAPRIVALGSPAVLERMGRRFEVLTGGARDLADHQRALRASIAWSWDLLDDFERACLAQCSVFRGGFTLTAAEAVVDLGDAPNAPAVVDVLDALRDKSLVFARSVAVLGGEHRFGLLESLREFVAEALAPAVAARARLRHARHYAFALDKLSPTLEAGDPTVVARLDLEKENLRVLVARAITPSRGESPEERREAADLALRALGAVDLARLPIPWTRLAEDLERVLEAASPGDSAVRGRALLRRAHVRWRIGPLSRAEAELEETIAMSRRVDDRQTEGRALAGLAMLLGQRKVGTGTLEALEDALAIHRAVGDRRYEASTLLRIGLQRGERGEVELARRAYEEALAVARAIGDARLQAETLSAIGILLAERQDYAAAVEKLEAACALGGGPMIECGLGLTCHAAGRLEDAARAFRRGIAAADARADRYGDGLNRGFSAFVAYEVGDVEGARAEIAAAQVRCDELGLGRYTAFFLAHLVTIEADPERPEEAKARLVAARAKLDLASDPFHLAIDLQEACVAAICAPPGADIEAAWGSERDRIVGPFGGHRIVEVSLSLHLAELRVREALRVAAAFAGLAVDADGRWFQLGVGPRVACGERAVLARLLARLAAGRVDAPGEPVTAEALIAAAWPGEKMRHTAAKNRLKVHVAKLRAEGLRAVLLSSDGGYFFDPSVPIRSRRGRTG